jgi:hypothetical protein
LTFSTRERGLAFTALTLPLHVLAACARFAGASLSWCAYHLVGPPRVPIEMLAAVDASTPAWPPHPVQPSLSVWTMPARRAARQPQVAA